MNEETKKENFFKDLWEKILLPALKSFWENNSGEIIGALKSIGASLIKAIMDKIKGKEEK